MATAYAAFTSLMHLTTQLHEHPYPPIQLDKKQFDSLSSNICFFQRFLEDHHINIDHELEIRIADAAHAAEDLIEIHIANRVPDLYESHQRVIEGMDLIKKEVMELNLNEPSHQRINRPTPYPTSHASSQSPSAASGENIVVGIEDITVNIVDKLTSSQHKSKRQIISISGMGGIGKTTLARKVYEHRYIKDYFDFFAWATISKDYSIHESLIEIHHCLDRSESKKSLREMRECELGEQMYQYLIGRRYLVVLDDMWDLEAWDSMRSFFPTNSGSGIVITTRESRFALISSHSFPMNLLDDRKSWDLFCKHVFGEGCCPVELESIGKKIAKKCRGLPLSIVVIGSHLAKSPRKPQYWENIAKNISSIDGDHCIKIVSLSYTYLPIHLKPCFLYMSIFLEDEEIRVSRLIRLWVAEGFVKPINGKSLEDTARDYLNDLIGRNLILAYELSCRGRIKSCKIHDLLRDFCLKEALRKNFICTVQKLDNLRLINHKRRIIVPPSALEHASTTDLLSKKLELLDNTETQMVNDHFDIGNVPKARVLLRSLIFGGELLSLENKLLRVLASYDEYSKGNRISHTLLPQVFQQIVNTRYLACSISDCDEIYELPSSISLLWNLQSLIIINLRSFIKAPPEIWKMTQLRHIHISRLILPCPPSEEGNMENLQSASFILNFNFCEEVVKRIRNIKKLVVQYYYAYEGFNEGLCTLDNVDRLLKLESFECLYTNYNVEQSHYMFRNLTFPHSLKKLSLEKQHWDDVTTKVGLLPLLEVLKLCGCRGREWKLVEGQFAKLKFLDLRNCYLRYFTANSNHFPCLQRLILQYMYRLEGISSEIGDIPTLELIKLMYCPDSAVISATEIAVEQHDLENQHLQVSAVCDSEESSLLGSLISTCNFHIEFC